jgi:hypothetical protein
MAFDTKRSPGPVSQLIRRVPSRHLAHEMSEARREGCRVRLFRPTRQELCIHGVDLMRADGLDRVAMAAYEASARSLEDDHYRAFFEDAAA